MRIGNPVFGRARKNIRQWRIRPVLSSIYPGLAIFLALGVALAAGCSSDDEKVEEPKLTSKFVYVTNGGSNSVSGYSIAPATGVLTELDDPAYSVGTGPTDVETDPEGRFLFVANATGNTISVFEIDSTTGALTEVSGSPFQTDNSPAELRVDAAGEFLYCVHSTGNSVTVQEIGPTGALSQVQSMAVAGNPSSLAIDSSGRFLFAARPPFGDLAALYIIARSGGLATVSGSPFALSGTPSDTKTHPAQPFVYSNDDSGSLIFGFKVSANTGALTAVPGGAVNIGSALDEMIIDPLGVHLYQGDESSLFTFEIGANGALTAAATPSIGISDYTEDFAFSADGKYLFKTNNTNNTITAFSRNATTGALTEITGSPITTGSSPFGIAVVSVYE